MLLKCMCRHCEKVTFICIDQFTALVVVTCERCGKITRNYADSSARKAEYVPKVHPTEFKKGLTLC